MPITKVQLGQADRTSWTWTHVEGDIVNLTGSALPADNDPNTTPPGARAVRLTIDMLSISGSGTIAVNCFEQSGTATVQPWIYDDANAKWFKYNVITPVSAANWSTITTVAGAIVGAKIFLQLVTNPGNWKAYAWTIK